VFFETVHPIIRCPAAQVTRAHVLQIRELIRDENVDPSIHAVHVASDPEPEREKPAGHTLDKVRPSPERTKLTFATHVNTEPPADEVPIGQALHDDETLK